MKPTVGQYVVGQYVMEPSHLAGARVAEVRAENDGVWLVLDRPHPLGGRISVGLDYVQLVTAPVGSTAAGDA